MRLNYALNNQNDARQLIVNLLCYMLLTLNLFISTDLFLVTISHFSFNYPTERDDIESDKKSQTKNPIIDADGDLIVERKRLDVIKIAHQDSTDLSLVGLQVWRGALLLADFLFHNRRTIGNKRILELGSGVGLTSIAAGIFSQTQITCTDIDLGGIIKLIKSNVDLNKNLLNRQATINVMELDFKKLNWSDELKKIVSEAKIIIAADGKKFEKITVY